MSWKQEFLAGFAHIILRSATGEKIQDWVDLNV